MDKYNGVSQPRTISCDVLHSGVSSSITAAVTNSTSATNSQYLNHVLEKSMTCCAPTETCRTFVHIDMKTTLFPCHYVTSSVPEYRYHQVTPPL